MLLFTLEAKPLFKLKMLQSALGNIYMSTWKYFVRYQGLQNNFSKSCCKCRTAS